MKRVMCALLGLPCLVPAQITVRLGPVLRGLEPAVTTTQQSEEDAFKIISAGYASQDGNNVHLEQGAHFRYKGYDIVADRVEGNLQTNIFRLYGKVQVRGKSLNYEGSDIEINLDEERIRFQDTRLSLGPERLKGNLKDNLYLTVGSGAGTEKRFQLQDSAATTCNLEHPHWSIDAEKIDVYGQEVVKFRHAKLRILDHTVISVPYFALPLKRLDPGYLPNIGQSSDEGVYVKTRTPIDSPGSSSFAIRGDAMSKKGLGLGLDVEDENASSRYRASLYGVIGPVNTQVASVEHDLRVRGFQFSTSALLNRLNYLSLPASTTTNLRSSLSHSLGRLSFSRNAVNRTSFSTENQSLNLSISPKLAGIQNSIDLNLSSVLSRSTSFSQSRRVLDIQTRSSIEFTRFGAELLYNRSVPIGTISEFFSSSDQTPLLNLTSDTSRLLRTPLRMPLLFSMGELIDAVRKKPISRMVFETSLPNRTTKQGRLALDYGGRFRQSLYSDDTAQFIGAYDARLGYQINPKNSLNLRYNYLRSQGYTPLSLDRVGRNDSATLDFTVDALKHLQISGYTGYEFLERPGKVTPWQTLGFRTEYILNEHTGMRTQASYDPFNQVWSQVRTDLKFRVQGADFAAGFRFDGQRHTFGQITFLAQGMRWGRLGSSLLLSYNGYSRKFESRQLQLIYDLHCAEAILMLEDQRTGFRNGTQVQFYLRLKALPFGTPFGVGTQGQGLGSGGFGF